MKTILTERFAGSIPDSEPADAVRGAIAEIASCAAGIALDEALGLLTRGSRPAERSERPRSRSAGSSTIEVASEGASPGAASAPVARKLVRQQRRVLRARKAGDLDAIAKRYERQEGESRGVWSRIVYRRIRAGVQDGSGRAAECLLYMLGTHEAAALAEHLDPRVPMDRRLIAFLYALETAPGSTQNQKVKLGLPLGLFAGVLSDPNNPNLERRRQFRPSRRTLYTDLERLDEHVGLHRWQVPVEVAEPHEMKRGAKHPTNRYWVPSTRDGQSMMAIALALGDVVPADKPNPSEEWSAQDAAALDELAAQLDVDGADVPSPSG